MHTHSISASFVTKLAFAAALTLPAAFTSAQTASQYLQTEARMLHQVQLGVISAVREVVIDGVSTGQGLTGGAAVGGAPGLQSGNATKTALGGLAGALLGQSIEQALARHKGVELLIRLDDASLVSVTQEVDGLSYAAGQRVRLLVLNGAARVVHHADAARPAVPAASAAGG